MLPLVAGCYDTLDEPETNGVQELGAQVGPLLCGADEIPPPPGSDQPEAAALSVVRADGRSSTRPSTSPTCCRRINYWFIETGLAHAVLGGYPCGGLNGYPCGGPGEPCDASSRPYFGPGEWLTRGQAAKIVSIGR